ncbi:PAS domain S-box-containing protein/diguanylate cyclase (GGDEF)-like protein [Paucimonas lemoignei]|uniref:PAS domain S-box-containing protein/diguanylate cyclase (GGDEF)-like protein n=1 Tax=Paucimonas lemoignei TaxID=29443 RepID=A0A4R3I0R1_PAULE|nr:EAL domain-containing protein [Paucimonas lemoignei]TCS39306.1 PAS domain S-box-containing protein/diguanylate cyclase (GGDEF)-like protein [Paucimonas lemoignei]
MIEAKTVSLAQTALLQLALSLAKLLKQVHLQRPFHGCLNPSTLQLSSDHSEPKLAYLMRHEGAAQPFAYMAPEQLGTIGRPADARSDLYSLGVVLYELATGSVPFRKDDPVELAHCHIAHQPVPPHELCEEVEPAFGRVILKLLQKDAADRYQSCDGLMADLSRCIEALDKQGAIPEFTLGRHDFAGRLHSHGKLLGRRNETRSLFQAYSRVSAGKKELVLISGFSGVGKSRLALEIKPTIADAGGIYLSGKFDQYKRNIPYVTIVQAIQEFVRGLLSMPEAQMERWRTAIQEAVGIQGNLLIDLIPELSFILGDPQRPSAALDPSGAENRLLAVFRQFIGVLASAEHPLVIFLDDLQWIDAGSRKLVADLVTHADVRYLMIVGAYRLEDPRTRADVGEWMESIRGHQGTVTEIQVNPLSREHVRKLVANILGSTLDGAGSLAALLHDRTEGNPLFVGQMLAALHEEHQLEFDPDSRSWKWDIDRIRNVNSSGNVVELVVASLRRLPEDLRELIIVLACLGTSTRAATLEFVYPADPAKIAAMLADLENSGFIRQSDEHVMFTHDRIHEAAYSLIAEEERAERHLKIGRRLSEQQHADPDQSVFDLAFHFNCATKLLAGEADKASLCRLNRLAGARARNAAAFQTAGEYLELAIVLLPSTAWEAQYRDTFELYLECGECQSVVGNFQRAELLLAEADSQAQSNRDRARIARILTRMYHFSTRGKDCMRVGMQTLSLFGITFPDSEEDLKKQADQDLQALDARLRQHGIDALLNLPVATDDDARLVIGFLADFLTVAYSTQPSVAVPILIRGIEYSLQYGNVEESCALYNNYGLLLAGMFGDLEAGYQYLQLALRLNERFQDPNLRGRLLYIHGYVFASLRLPKAECLPILEDAFKACRDVGHIGFAGASIDAYIWTAWETGMPLAEVRSMAAPYRDLSRVTNSFQANCIIAMLEMLISQLDGSANPGCDTAFLRQINGAGWIYTLAHFHITQQIAHYHLGDFAKSLDAAQPLDAMPVTLKMLMSMATHHFYHALAIAASYDQATPEQQRLWMETLNRKLAELEKWASQHPGNYQARHALVMAEVARINKDENKALACYEQAIASARRSKNLHDDAIANELTGRFHVARGLPMTGYAHLVMARDIWLRWGATAKASKLEQAFPDLRLQQAATSLPSSMRAGRFSDLDILTAAKAAQAVSGEMELDRLTQSLLQTVMQYAGADRGVLLLAAGGDYRVVAEASVQEGAIKVILEQAPLAMEALPRSILNYVTRTSEKILLADATQHHPYSADAYLKKNRPKSLLCLPLLKQSRLIGLLYLENRLAGAAFGKDRLTILELLTAQAVISLENAKLYEELHAENRERRRVEEALKAKTRELEEQADFMHAVVENIPVGVFVKDARNEFRYTLWNKAAEEIFKVPKDAVIGRKPTEIWSDELLSRMRFSDDAVTITKERVDAPEERVKNALQDSIVVNTIKVPIINKNDGELDYLLGISDDITERKRSESLIWQQANFDSLTGLPNRSCFRDKLSEAMGKSRAEGSSIAVLFIDLDRFKEVNDSLGHACGDMLLVAAARRISDCVRVDDVVARLGGDEFTVILSQLEYPGHIEEISQRIIDALAVPFQLGQDQGYISASIGITVFPDDADDIDELIKRADQALYIAKDSGRNQFGYFTPEMQAASMHRMRLTNDLRSAMSRNELAVYFQPIVDLATGQIGKAEALLRWNHPELGVIDPSEFVPLAESSGLIVHFGDWIFEKVAHVVKRWRSLYSSNFQVSINQSPLEFQRHDDRYVRWVSRLSELELSGQGIVLEITEGLLLDASTNVIDKLRRLREAGVEIALDDFGTGYSSLAYLQKFHIDYLKIDRAFTMDLELGSDNLALCEAIIMMAHKLGLKVIAEGVEVQEQHKLLQMAGCDYDQGYLFSRPLPESEFEALLSRHAPVDSR